MVAGSWSKPGKGWRRRRVTEKRGRGERVAGEINIEARFCLGPVVCGGEGKGWAKIPLNRGHVLGTCSFSVQKHNAIRVKVDIKTNWKVEVFYCPN